ncbi:MAG: heparinase II/III family protein [Planctomycetes bacterium]|nr:heparinase II/III family protein [Planctomycetota bacterium]
MLLAVAGAALAEPPKPGDVNHDGRVDVSDVARLFEHLALGRLGICRTAADTNRDGRVNYADAVAIVEHIFELGKELPPLPPEVTSCVEGTGALEIRGLEVTVLSPHSAMVSWDTPYPSTTRVRLGIDEALLGGDVVLEESATQHRALLKGLAAGTTYHLEARSDAASGLLSASSEVFSFPTLDDPGYSVRDDHPRLFLTARDIPEIRRSIEDGGATEALWKEIVQWCDARLDEPIRELAGTSNVDGNLRAFSFLGLVGGRKHCRKRAIEGALYLVENGPGDDVRASVEGLAYVFDWLHDDLSEAERSAILKALVRNCLALAGSNRDHEFVTGQTHGNQKSLILGALAAYGHHPAAAKLADDAFADYRSGFLATWRRFAGSDGGSSKGWWYTTYVLPFELEFFAAWRSATGQDLFQEERSWCEGVLDWFLYGLRGDGTFIREGDVRIFNGLNHQNRHHGLLLAKEYGSSRGQWLAERVAEVTPPWGPQAVFDLLWRDPGVEPEPPSGPTSRLFRQVGVAIMRESWDRDAAIAHFRSAEAYTLGHTHRDNCSFTLFYMGGLAIDSGIYDDFDSKHRDNYYTRTVAHNGILVFDPDEVFSLYGTAHVNDGGQRWLVAGEDAPRHWPARAEDTVRRADGYRLGGVTRWEDAEDHTYVVGNGGPSYSRKKLKKLFRHFLWLKSVSGWDHPVAVVFDDVVATRPAFRKTYLLHTVNKPEVEGRWLTAKNGGGRLYQATLAPRDAELRLVGGPGKEYWVNGRNFPTVRPPQEMEEAGSWRLEVSPRGARSEDRFLHVLYPGDADAPRPAEPEAFEAGPLQGCRVGQWTVLFDAGSPPEVIEYSSPRSESSHLVLGAVPQAAYDLHVDGSYRGTLAATFAGTLRFDLKAPGAVRLARSGG